jgi:hypothetical protein
MECANGSDQGSAQAQKQAESWAKGDISEIYDDAWNAPIPKDKIPLWLIGLAAAMFAALMAAAAMGQTTELSESRKVLSVDVRTETGASRGYGSGTVIATQGDRAYILTARHLFRPIDSKREIVDYSGQHYPAKVLAVSETSDLALMETETPSAARARLQARGLDPAKSFALSFADKAPDRIQIAGYGEGRHQLAAQTGEKISGPHKLTTKNRTLEDCYLYSVQPRDGDSGGGAFSAEGFAGVVTHRADDGTAEGVVIGPDGIRKFLETQCIGGWCSTGLSIDAPGFSFNRFSSGFGGGGVLRALGAGLFGGSSGPVTKMKFVSRGFGFPGFVGGAYTYPAYSSFPVFAATASPYTSFAAADIAPVIQTIPSVQTVRAPAVQTIAPSPQVPVVTQDLSGRLTVLESQVSQLQQIVSQPITFLSRAADGSLVRLPVYLGGAVGLGHHLYQP